MIVLKTFGVEQTEKNINVLEKAELLSIEATKENSAIKEAQKTVARMKV